ncbi:MAG: hypothetical protein AAF330_05180 [Pseudomonadota bacterium]
MAWLTRLIPSRAQVFALLTALGTLILALARRDARQDQRTKTQLEDHEHAQDITDSVSRSRADPERLRQFEGQGYRD